MIFLKFFFKKNKMENRDLNIIRNKKDHTYLVNGENFKPVSTLISELFEPILFEYKENNENEHKKAINLGNKIHDVINKYFLDTTFTDKSIEFQYFLNFMNDNNLKLFKQEWPIYDEYIKIAGTLDCILYNDKKELFLIDWKRIKKLRYTSTSYGKYEFMKNIPNTNYWKYVLQLNFYKKILENYNINIKKLYLVIFHENNENYKIVNIPIKDYLIKNIYNLIKNLE